MPELTTETNSDDVHAPGRANTVVHRKLREESDTNLLDYLKSLATDTPIKVTVIRQLPKTWEGRTIEGTLDSFEEPISEEEIRELFGGGKYKLTIYTPNEKGSWQYETARSIKIAGDPKLDAMITTGGNQRSGGEDPSVILNAMKMSADAAERAERRAEKAAERGTGPDQATHMMMMELSALRKEMADKDARMFELATKKPDSSTSDALLEKMMDGESVRLQGLRQQVESEIRMKNESHKAEIDRLHGRYEDIARRQEEAHRREMDNLVRSHDNLIATMKIAHKGQLDGLSREIDHLGRTLVVAQTSEAELRAKKDRNPIEVLTELAAMKDAMESFSGKGEEPSGGALERIVGNVMGSPLLEGIASRVAGGPGAMGAEMPQPEAEEEPEIPINRPVQMPDGRIIVRKPDGRILQLRQKEAPPAPTGEPGADVSDEEIGIAMQFMETALGGDADPAEFGRTARNLVPSLTSGPIQSLLASQGVDAFLARVSKLNPNSALLSQHGKNWARKVAAVLLES